MWCDPIQFHAASSRAAQTALVDVPGGSRLTYGAWNREIGCWATWLVARGVRPDDRVAILAENRVAHLSLFFACARLGATLVPLNYRLSSAELAVQLDLVTPRLLLVDAAFACEDRPVILLDDVCLPDAETAGAPQPLDRVLLLLFTSGSTGVPKAVMLHAGMLLWNAFHTIVDWGLSAEDITVLHTPLFHTGGWNVSSLPLWRQGGCVVLSGPFTAESVLTLIPEERVSVFFAVPTMYAMMAAEPAFAATDLSCLRLCLSGGAALPAALRAVYQARGVPLREGFGLTEVGPNCFTMTAAEAAQRTDTVGRPMPHGHAVLLDAALREVEVGEVGELALSGPHVCAGYYRNAEAFAAAQVALNGRTYFRTGDLMRRDADGFFAVVGRCKDMFISGGENVWPGEVERALTANPTIGDCRVVPVPDSKWGEVGFAFYVGEPLSSEAMRSFLDARLARYKHPRYLHRLSSFPLLGNGKVDVRQLTEMALAEVQRASTA